MCWAAFGRWCADRIAAGRSQGSAKTNAGAKAKGRAAVQLVAERIRTELDLEHGDVWVKAGSQLGDDLHLSPLAASRFPFSTEIKNQERLDIWGALRQAEERGTVEKPAVLFFKRAKTKLYVALESPHFFSLVRNARRS